ncbi:hypothetical protein GCM10011316_27220 [Roseibium aquae]|uniref:Uncharacterized protein n=1 Tax=Roseibium aquae TaxID=1323746 RepID=A0A916TLV5_9HYPH|nr:hypothetical protein [Roseibium aquae]GGB53747.1 hypothetical protein GCM10011316_27220 [Roseibium aquae]
MISALVDGLLLIALVATTYKMVAMYRELKRLGAYHDDYQRIFDQTAIALDGIEVSIQELNVKGSQVLNALGSRMNDARDLIGEIDAITREAKRQQAVLKAELRELSKATALHAKALSRCGDADLGPFASQAPADLMPAGATLTNQEPGGDTPLDRPAFRKARDTRVHRLDNTYPSPFRSVNLSSKDKI